MVIIEYNKTKGGVDNADKMIREYTCARRTSRWPFRLFMNMLDIGALNSFIIWMMKNSNWNESKPNRRQKFLLELGRELMMPNIVRRASNPVGLQLPIIRAIESVGTSVNRTITSGSTQSTSEERINRKRGRCYYCQRNNDRKVNTTCSHCKRFVCEKHRKTITTTTCAEDCIVDI